MDDRITIDGAGMMRQASATADDYLSNAIDDIEKRLGEGAAKKYPQIVAAYMQAAAIDCGAAIIAQQIRSGLDAIEETIGTGLRAGLGDIAENVRSDHPLMAESFSGIEGSLRSIAEMLDGK